MIAISYVDIRNPRFLHGAFSRNIEYGRFFSIVNTRLFGIFTLLVIRLDFAHQVGRQILHSCLRVALEEVLTVNEKLLNRLAIPLNGTVVTDFNTGQLLNQCFQG
ncbi:hypothetical protein EVA_06314 [gut metagenome]|uniref:Uncharacterized protein n=1 Tax=gut metagenome TaxID=749906 RepID=J9CZ88_9ZZZZ